jgi:ureidoglycolate dehydrogenase (NAD+)
MKVKHENLRSFCIDAMIKFGMRKTEAETTADVMVTTDLMGINTHGSKQLYLLLKNMKEGGLDVHARPEVINEGPGFAIIDGNFAMPMVTAAKAMNIAIKKAQEACIAYVGVKRSSHFGAAGFYANMAAKKGLIGLSMSNVDPCMAIPGGKTPLLGTNPLAYAVPTSDGKSVFLDIATSVSAVSKIFAAKTLGKPIPDGWLIDSDGKPTNDPMKYPENACILPMAGHKGYGIALLIEVLSAIVTDALFTLDVPCWVRDFSKPADQGHAFIAIDIKKLIPITDFNSRMEKMIDQIHDAPKAGGIDKIYLPGEMEWEKYDRQLKDGIELPEDAVINLKKLSEEFNLDFDKLN